MKKKILNPALCLLALFLLPAPGKGADPVPAELDAITAASITISMGAITATTAIVKYTNDRYNSGTRTLCYDPAPASPTHNCIAHPAGGVNNGSFTLSNLIPNTSYNYKITASDGRHNPYSASGTFTTSQAVGIMQVQMDMRLAAPIKGDGYDVRGRKTAAGRSRGMRILRPAP